MPAQAQRVSADIIIGGGPIAGRISIGGRPRPIRGVEWVRSRDYRRDDWWRSFQRGSRLVVVFWDRDDDSYYFDRFRPGLLEIRLFERDGRYYRLEDDGYDFPGYGYGYSQPRYQVPRYDPRDDRRFNNNRREDRRDDRRDNRRDGRDDRRDNRDGRDNRRDNGHDNGRGHHGNP